MRQKIIFLLCLCLLNVFPAHSKVLWIGRNIDLESNSGQKTHRMLTAVGHSYLILLPDNPARLRKVSALYKKHEKNLGCGHKGVIVGAYPKDGSDWLANMDGWLKAQINEPLDIGTTYDYLCGTAEQKKIWNFVGGTVYSSLSDNDFIDLLLTNTMHYINNTKRTPVNYHTIRSLLEAAFSVSDSYANNCNAFAFSLLAWSKASHAPDLGATREMPGSRKLLKEFLFGDGLDQLWDASKDYTPELVKNDKEYRKRVETTKQQLKQQVKTTKQKIDRRSKWFFQSIVI